MKKYTLDEIKEIGWFHGFSFVKHTQQIKIDDDLKYSLDSKQAILAYHDAYNSGFEFAIAKFFRTDDFDD